MSRHIWINHTKKESRRKIILDKFLHRICRADIIYNTIKKIWKHVGTLGDLFRACTIIEKTDYQHISNTLGDYK